jgi:hypothetical protein
MSSTIVLEAMAKVTRWGVRRGLRRRFTRRQSAEFRGTGHST